MYLNPLTFIFYSWQLRKRHNFVEHDKHIFGPSYFVRALDAGKNGLVLCIRLDDTERELTSLRLDCSACRSILMRALCPTSRCVRWKPSCMP